MDAAYDHIQEEVLRSETPKPGEGQQRQEGSLNTEFQEAYRTFSASPWGTKLGGLWGAVRKQGETLYQGAQEEASAVREEALKGFTDLKSTLATRARSLSTGEGSTSASKAAKVEGTEGASNEQTDREVQESESIISRLKSEAAKRLKDIEKAEDAADEALLKFGTNLRNFLKDAVSIAPPSEEDAKAGKKDMLYESKDQDGKRVIHSTRFDARLHVIHSSPDSFTKDPASSEYDKWSADFDAEKKTDDISKDLEKYEELRRAMEKLVPEKVEYAQFWRRYYFLRMVIESEENRRKELLKGAAVEEEVAWDEDSDSDTSSTPKPETKTTATKSRQPLHTTQTASSASTPTASTTLSESSTAEADQDLLKPSEPRKSQDLHSQPDSDASYDLVSGATTGAPGSPGEEKLERVEEGEKKEDSDEEDWE
ncbi:MAG: hypothetical protein MMC33_009840 [Icmadophila ericetorum]|nr:hypothetical protein [Icmadophila ericetorum]